MTRLIRIANEKYLELLEHVWILFKWLLLKPVANAKKLVVVIILFSVLGICCQLGGLLVLVKLVGLFQSNWEFSFFGFNANLSLHKDTVFWSISFTTFILLLFSAIFSYLSRRYITKMARLTEEYCNVDLAICYKKLLWCTNDQSENLTDVKSMQEYYARGGRYIGRAVIALVGAIVPTVTMIAGFVALVYLKPLLTFSFMGVMIVALPGYLHITRRGVKASQALTKEARKAVFDRQLIFDRIRFSVSLDDVDKIKAESIIDTEASINFMDAYELRLKIGALVSSFTQFLQAFMVIIILLGMVHPLLDDYNSASITGVLTYLVIFRFFGGGLQTFVGAIIVSNLFYSYCQPMILFFENAQKSFSSSKSLDCLNKEEFVNLKHPIAVGIHQQFDWTIAGKILQSLGLPIDKKLELCRLISCSQPAVGNDLLASLGVPEAFTVQDLVDWQPLVARRSKVVLEEALEMHRTGRWDKSEWPKFSKAAKLTCALWSLRDNEKGLYLLLDGPSFQTLKPIQQKALLTSLIDHQIILVYSGKSIHASLHEIGVRDAFWLGEDGVVWSGDVKEANANYPDAFAQDKKIDSSAFDNELELLM